MALDPSYFFYSDGTITLTHGSDIATGDMVVWDPAVLPFDFVFPNNGTDGMTVIKEVLSVNQIRLAKPWTGPTLTDVPYFMLRWVKHTDPKVYAIRVSEYLTRLKSIPGEIEDALASALAQINGVVGAATALRDTKTAAAAAIIPPEALYIRTAGYAAIGDGGGALYKKIAAPSVPKAWHFQSADGAWWELAESRPNVKMFGAKGDGVADDYAALQAAIDYMPNSTVDLEWGGVLAVPTGTYRITQRLTINKNLTIEGDGNTVFTGNLSGLAVGVRHGLFIGSNTYLTETSQGYYRVIVRRITFKFTGHEMCVRSVGLRTVRFEECAFNYGTSCSLLIDSAWSNAWVKSCWFSGGPATALIIQNNSNAFLIEGNRFAGYDDTPTDGRAITVKDCSGVWITKNDFEYSRYQINAFSTGVMDCNNLHIENNWIEGAVANSITLDNTTSNFKGLTICGNSIYDQGSSGPGGVYLGVAGGAGIFSGVIEGNTFHGQAKIYMRSDGTKYENLLIRGNTPDDQNGPAAFAAVKSAAQTLPAAAYTLVTWETKRFDRGGFFTDGSSRFSGNQWTPPRGLVRIEAQLRFTPVSNYGTYGIAIYKNGTALKIALQSNAGTGGGDRSVSVMDMASGTDVYAVYAYAESAADVSADQSRFEGYQIQ